jgi:hypothetical protein
MVPLKKCIIIKFSEWIWRAEYFEMILTDVKDASPSSGCVKQRPRLFVKCLLLSRHRRSPRIMAEEVFVAVGSRRSVAETARAALRTH